MLQSGDLKPRVFVRGRTYPGLSTTRSLGDLLAHHIGVTSEPSFKIVHISSEQSERFIALGTDGIWDNLTSEEVVENINEHYIREIGTASEFVVNKIRDMTSSNSVTLDDMTLLISYLKREGSC